MNIFDWFSMQGQNRVERNAKKAEILRTTPDNKKTVNMFFLSDGTITWGWWWRASYTYALSTLLIFFICVYWDSTEITTDDKGTERTETYAQFKDRQGEHNFRILFHYYANAMKYIPLALEDSITLRTGTFVNVHSVVQVVAKDFDVEVKNIPKYDSDKELEKDMEDSIFWYALNIYRLGVLLLIIIRLYQLYAQRILNEAQLFTLFVPALYIGNFFNRTETLSCKMRYVDPNKSKVVSRIQQKQTTKNLFDLSEAKYNSFEKSEVVLDPRYSLDYRFKLFFIMNVHWKLYSYMYVYINDGKLRFKEVEEVKEDYMNVVSIKEEIVKPKPFFITQEDMNKFEREKKEKENKKRKMPIGLVAELETALEVAKIDISDAEDEVHNKEEIVEAQREIIEDLKNEIKDEDDKDQDEEEYNI